MVGDGGCGKTYFLGRHITGKLFSEYVPTVIDTTAKNYMKQGVPISVT